MYCEKHEPDNKLSYFLFELNSISFYVSFPISYVVPTSSSVMSGLSWFMSYFDKSLQPHFSWLTFNLQYNIIEHVCEEISGLFVVSVQNYPFNFSHLHYNVIQRGCDATQLRLKLQNSLKLPRLHARFYYNANVQSKPWKGLLARIQVGLHSNTNKRNLPWKGLLYM